MRMNGRKGPGPTMNAAAMTQATTNHRAIGGLPPFENIETRSFAVRW